MNIIEIKNLTKVYDEKTIPVYALNGVNLSFREGEFTSIVGPSGSGKTTLLNLMGGLDAPTSGEIVIDQTDITRLKSRKLIDFRLRNIGFVFQSFNLIPVLTAKENVEFIMQLQGVNREQRDLRTLELLKSVGLGDKINARPGKLSGGQQQRVAVARALASKPKFILADEPTANLDSKSAENLLEIMEKLNREENITFIFSTHDSRVVAKARRVITLEDGKIVGDVLKNSPPKPPLPLERGPGGEGQRIETMPSKIESVYTQNSARVRSGRVFRPALKSILPVALFLLFTLPAHSQDSIAPEKERNWSFNGYVKDMQSAVIHDINKTWITSNLIHNRLNFRWNISNSFTFLLEERNRFYWGDLVALTPQYKDFIAADNGLVNLNRNIFTGKSFILNVSIDRLWLDYTRNNFQATVGRQRINWSQTFVWNPNDIFNTYSYFDFDYEEKPGSDAVRLQYFTSASSKAELAVKADNHKKITAAGLYRFNKWRYDFQGLTGVLTQSDLVLGLGWSGQIAKGGFKGEMSWFHPLKHFSDTAGVLLASVEYDYTFRNAIIIRFEGFYNSNSSNSSNILLSQFNPDLLNVKNPFLTGVSLYGSISCPVTPLISLALAGIYNPYNRMYFIIPTFTFSLMNNLDLSLIAQGYQSYDPPTERLSQTTVYIRLKGSF